jgi:hypothetical protein
MIPDAERMPSMSHAVVIVTKANGVRVLFARCADLAAAKATVSALARHGLHAEAVDGVDADARPGSAVMPSRGTR